jgi:hypothetical protein
MAAAAKLASGFAFRSDILAENPANRVQSKRLLIVAWRISLAGSAMAADPNYAKVSFAESDSVSPQALDSTF